MLQQNTDCECDNESDEEMVVGVQSQTLPVTEDVVDDKRGGKVCVNIHMLKEITHQHLTHQHKCIIHMYVCH